MNVLTGVSLRNIRLFSGDTPYSFPLKPFSVFVGTNSSGKSTVLKAVSLIRQSQGFGDTSEVTNSRLRFKGNQVDLGNFKTLRSDSASGAEVEIGFTIEGEQTLAWRRWLDQCYEKKAFVSYIAQSGDQKLAALVAKVQLTFSSGETGKTGLLSKGSIEIEHGERRYLIKYKRKEEKEGTVGENIFEISLPAAIVYASNANGLALGDAIDSDGNLPFACQVRGLLPAVLFMRAQNEVGKGSGSPWTNGPLPPFLQSVVEFIKRALFGIHYLGPLRSFPKRYYQIDVDERTSLDPAGEFLPSILRSSGLKKIQNCGPGDAKATAESLSRALNRWLAFFRTGHRSDYDKINSEYKIKESDAYLEVNLASSVTKKKHPLVDSGFGLSQVFPVLATCLMAEPGELVIVEQPEVHLHPALQVRLSEFFAAMVLAGKRLMIETHSEHLVNGIRVLVAERPDSKLAEKTGIYFLHANNKKVVVQDMSVKSDGSLSDWPREFFGEAMDLSARLLRAQRNQRASIVKNAV
jgi:predicted ATPase